MKVKFSIDKLDFIEDVKDNQFAVFKVFAFASGDNAHGLPVSVNTLRKTAYTIYNKPIVWKYEWFIDDAGGHEEDEVPCGFVFKEDNPIKFTKLKDGRIMLVVNALIWKRYSGKLMEIFARDDAEKSVSVEIEVTEIKETEDGKKELLDFIYAAITILGERITPAIPLARAEVLKFSQDKKDYEEAYNEYFESKYEDINFSIPSRVKKNVELGFSLKDKHKFGYGSKILSIARYLQNNDEMSSSKVKNFCTYLPNFNFSEINESEPPTKEYVKSLLCGGEHGVNWLKELHASMIDSDSKLIGYFNTEKTKDFESTDVDDENLDTNEANIGKEDKARNMAGTNFSIKTYNELREKLDAFLNDFRDEEGYCRYYVVDFLLDETSVIVRDMSEGKYMKVRYEDGEEGTSMYLEDAEEVRTAWTTDFSAEGAEHTDEATTGGAEGNAQEETAHAENAEEFSEEGETGEATENEEGETSETGEEGFAKKEDDEDKEEKEEKEDEAEFAQEEAVAEQQAETPKAEEDSTNSESEKFQSEIDALKAENELLKKFKADAESEKKNFEVERTIKEVIEKCPNMPTSEIESLREDAVNFSLESIDAWKNKVKAMAWNFSTTEPTKDGIVRIGLDKTTVKPQSEKKKLWT